VEHSPFVLKPRTRTRMFGGGHASRTGEQYLDARSSAIQWPARIAARERLMKALKLSKCDPLGRGKSVPFAVQFKATNRLHMLPDA